MNKPVFFSKKPAALRSELTANANNTGAHAATSFVVLATGQQTLHDVYAIESPTSRFKKLVGLPAYHWILLAQLFVILPHLTHLPGWLIGFALVTIGAQLPSVKARFKSLKALKRLYQGVQMVGFLAGLAGLWLTYQMAFGLDVGVAFLVLCLISKLWELYQRRDAFVVLNLSLFVLASLFLMDQGLGTTLIVALGTLVVLLAFIAMNDTGNDSGEGRLRTLGLLGGAAIPLLIVLFLFFPRLPPLWSVQLSGQKATTGVSDSMSPGDFANLSQSTELAFRVEFPGAPPPQSEMYWRGLVFSDFDGMTWTRNPNTQAIWPERTLPTWLQQALATVPEAQKQQLQPYRIILEPTQQSWLYGLDYPLTQAVDIGITPQFTLLRRQPVTQQLRYDVLRLTPMRIDTELSPQERQVNLTLPRKGNEQTRALSQQLFAQSGNNPQRYIAAILAWISQTEFRYTLSPPPLPNDRIDSFLFETKAGFCEHYSSSFTFLMRAAGIPARVVAGYQGGELARNGEVWEVRQLDAHAWSEVWLAGQGWVRVDPTAFVAPERVEQGMDALTQNQGAALFGSGASAQMSYQQFRMLQSLRRLSDQASYYWQKDVVGYDQDKQAKGLFKWLKITSIVQQIVWMAALGVSLLSIIGLLFWWRRRRRWHPVDLPLVQLSKRLSRRDAALGYSEKEGLLDWLERVQPQVENEQSKAALETVKHDYRRLRYGRLSSAAIDDSDYQQTLQSLKTLTKTIK
jgi:transglutaminase-like putative cysteine protease